MPRDWFWELQAARQGPDWYFFASFNPADAAPLAARVRLFPWVGFVYQPAAGLCARHRQHSAYELYIDQNNAGQLAANRQGDQPRNLWVYHAVEVCGSDLTLTRGYGGYPDSHGAAETELLAALAQAPDLTLSAWQVGYAGDGYPAGQVAAGATAAELLAYLRDG